MPVETWLIFLLGFMILGSIVALEIRDILSSIVAVGVVGLAVSIAFLFLQAPDLAVVQFLFEIFALIILVCAFVRKEFHALEPVRSSRWIFAFTLIGLAAILILSFKVFRILPLRPAPHGRLPVLSGACRRRYGRGQRRHRGHPRLPGL